MGALLTLLLFSIKLAVREVLEITRMFILFFLALFLAGLLIFAGLFLAGCWVDLCSEHRVDLRDLGLLPVPYLMAGTLAWIGVLYLVFKRGIDRFLDLTLKE